MTRRVLGIIGGSGVYAIDGLDRAERFSVDTPWGAPSDALVKGQIGGVDVVFLSRHGAGHRIPPDAINYRANIDAFKQVGVTDVISLSACGSFREELAPGTFVIVDQFLDRTTNREKSFFGPGFVAHVSMAQPVCPGLVVEIENGCKALNIPYRCGGTYVCIDGPQFSSLAESTLYRSWGCDVIGMTNMPEAKLAREAELPYASIAMVTDYDCWREEKKAVEVADVLETMQSNTNLARQLIAEVAVQLGPERTPSPLGVETVLDIAVMTSPDARDAEMCRKLSNIAGRILKR